VICSPVYIGKTGLIRQEALNYGFDPIEEQIESITMAGYYPGSKSIWLLSLFQLSVVQPT
jgi:hypothetical protein